MEPIKIANPARLGDGESAREFYDRGRRWELMRAEWHKAFGTHTTVSQCRKLAKAYQRKSEGIL